MPKNNIKLALLISIVAFMFSGSLESLAKEPSPVEQSLINTANELNKRVPIMLDVDTRLDGVFAFKKTLRYKYTLLNTSNDRNYLRKLKQIKEPELVNNMCSSKNTSIVLKGGVNFTYIYFDEKGTELMRFDIDKSKCRF